MKTYNGTILTWSNEEYFFELNEYLENSQKKTEIKVYKHESDDCLGEFYLPLNACSASKVIEGFSVKDTELLIKNRKLSEEVENFSIDFDCTERGLEEKYGHITYCGANDLLYITKGKQELTLTPLEGDSLFHALKKLFEAEAESE